MLRNLASKSFDSISSSSSSTGGGTNGSQDSSVYDKLRLLSNSAQPWPTHSSAWYVPSASSVNISSTHSLLNSVASANTPNGAYGSDNIHNSSEINKLNMSNGECKKGKKYF